MLTQWALLRVPYVDSPVAASLGQVGHLLHLARGPGWLTGTAGGCHGLRTPSKRHKCNTQPSKVSTLSHGQVSQQLWVWRTALLLAHLYPSLRPAATGAMSTISFDFKGLPKHEHEQSGTQYVATAPHGCLASRQILIADMQQANINMDTTTTTTPCTHHVDGSDQWLA